ncbi:MAG: NUDIX hydrolase [Oscillospiraceae bacterium]|nr:NUDIX hydrolase [Oscillospiraceae bacterium]
MFIEQEISRETVYHGKIVNVRRDIAQVHNGTQVGREVVEHPGGVCIVPVEADGTCWCVRQFRYPFMESLLELPAGKLEYGEDPLECAIRELSEETGLTAGQVIDLGPLYPSPGYLNEVIHLYLATDLTQGDAHPDENEFLSVERHSIEELLIMAAENKLPDAKTLVGLFKAKAYLQR